MRPGRTLGERLPRKSTSVANAAAVTTLPIPQENSAAQIREQEGIRCLKTCQRVKVPDFLGLTNHWHFFYSIVKYVPLFILVFDLTWFECLNKMFREKKFSIQGSTEINTTDTTPFLLSFPLSPLLSVSYSFCLLTTYTGHSHPFSPLTLTKMHSG